MMKGPLRFALIWGLSLVLTPYVNRLFSRMIELTPSNSILEEIFHELRKKYSTTLVRSVGEGAGEIIFGPKTKGRGVV
jgi:hypothetical protein